MPFFTWNFKIIENIVVVNVPADLFSTFVDELFIKWNRFVTYLVKCPILVKARIC